MSDERLVGALRSGDERAFEVLYDRYHGGLLVFCRHMLGSREEAEDALQHVFIAAHRHLRADARPITVRPWLYAVARNRCLSILRARRDTVAIDAIQEPSTDGLAVVGVVEQRQDLKDMLADVARLPEAQRAALVLAEIGDIPHDEIATALDVPRAKVRALIFQARESLASYRRARETPCQDIREELATARGADRRRGYLRRHLAVCPACASFDSEVTRQSKALALILPVVPTLALKHSVLSAAAGSAGGATATGVAGAIGAGGAGGAGAGAGAAGAGAAVGATTTAGAGVAATTAAATTATAAGAAAAGSSGVALKLLVVAAIATGAGGGSVALVRQAEGGSAPRSMPAVKRAAPAASQGPGVAGDPGVGRQGTGAAARDADRGGSHGAGTDRGAARGRSRDDASPGGSSNASRRADGQAGARGTKGPRKAAKPGRRSVRTKKVHAPPTGTARRAPAASTPRPQRAPAATKPSQPAPGPAPNPTQSSAPAQPGTAPKDSAKVSTPSNPPVAGALKAP